MLPGVYTRSRQQGPAAAGCEDDLRHDRGPPDPLTYEEHRQCPNVQNLIAILGDTNGNRICDSKCNIQIEGTGDPGRTTSMIDGNRIKLNMIRVDRADGVYITNMTVELSDFNNIYVIETNGFRIDRIVLRATAGSTGSCRSPPTTASTRTARPTYNGDSGVYPGSGPDARHGQPDAHGHVYGIVIRHCDSHDNTIGYSGTAGNGIWAHHNRFHHNSTGITTGLVRVRPPGHAAGQLEVDRTTSSTRTT